MELTLAPASRFQSLFLDFTQRQRTCCILPDTAAVGLANTAFSALVENAERQQAKMVFVRVPTQQQLPHINWAFFPRESKSPNPPKSMT